MIPRNFERRGRPSLIKTCLTLAAMGIAPVAVSKLHAQVVTAEPEYTGEDRIEKWSGKTVLAITPHPDDETFSAGGLLAMLAANGNNVQILIYTTDNAGSNDPTMTKERLADIRRQEEEDACAILKIPKDHITWLGHDDGMLEYVDRREAHQASHAPDSPTSPGRGAIDRPRRAYEQWHKSDHRSGAQITVDAMSLPGGDCTSPNSSARVLSRTPFRWPSCSIRRSRTTRSTSPT